MDTTLSNDKVKEATEMWFYRRMMRISYSEHMSNVEVLRKVEGSRNVIRNTRKRQLKFLGHIMRKDGIENLCITGFVDCKSSRTDSV